MNDLETNKLDEKDDIITKRKIEMNELVLYLRGCINDFESYIGRAGAIYSKFATYDEYCDSLTSLTEEADLLKESISKWKFPIKEFEEHVKNTNADVLNPNYYLWCR